MFNTGAFNTLLFNRVQDSGIKVYFKADIIAYFDSSMASMRDIFLNSSITSRFEQRNDLVNGKFLNAVLDSHFEQAARLEHVFALNALLGLDILGDTHLAAVIRPSSAAGSQFSGRFRPSFDWRFRHDIEENVSFEGFLGSDWNGSAILGGRFDGSFSLVRFTIEYLRFYGTLMPGDVLIIDSDNYTASLNGENALAYIDGTWPWITPDIYDVEFSAIEPDPDLSVNLLYREMWL